MALNKLWAKLIDPATLKRGWHIARPDIRQDFAENLFEVDSFAADLDLRIIEIINRLRTHSFQPQPLISVDVPKGTLAIRPGRVINVTDRTVLSAIVFLIAPKLDPLLGDEVYSWRLKKPVPKKGDIFAESSILDLPFLKTKTVRSRLDAFEPWYANWPEFDSQSRRNFESGSYRYLATSDIAAYFENIQLPILRDQLLTCLPDEPKILNLLFEFLNFWAQRTEAGRPHFRGIPQGNAISSFLGNIFLLPLDQTFQRIAKNRDIQYCRYMDDVRVFTTTMADARFAIFEMDKVLRSLHLNVQSAKTKIYDESRGEITRELVDSRVEELSALIDQIVRDWKGKPLSRDAKTKIEARLNRIAKVKPMGREPLLGARSQLSGLSLRAFQRWIAAHSLIGSHKYVPRLLGEIEKNPDSRLMKRLIRAARQFPRNSSIENRLMAFIKSDQNIFRHQEAECLRAIRYLSRISDDTIAHCKLKVTSKGDDTYLRVQGCYLLSRTLLSHADLQILRNRFATEQDPQVQAAICGLLVQDSDRNREIVDLIAFHPNERVRDLGKLFQRISSDAGFVKAKLNHIFNAQLDWLICDNIPLLHLMSMSKAPDIRHQLKERVRRQRRTTTLVGLRPVLDVIYERVDRPD